MGGEVLIIVLLIPAIIWAWGYGALLMKRYSFVRKLNRFCRKKGFAVTWLRSPMKSACQMDGCADFVLDTHQMIFRVTIFSTKYRYREHCFISPEELHIIRNLRLRRVLGNRVRSKIQTVSLGTTTRSCAIHLMEETLEGETKILLFYPVPMDVNAFHGTKKVTLGNGDMVVNDYYLMTRSAFFRELEDGTWHHRKKNAWDYE